MATDRTTDNDREARAGLTRATAAKAGSRPTARSSGAGGRRTRPPTQVVTQSRPWGLIAAALAVVVFAVAVIGYAVVAVNRADADKVTSAEQITGLQSYDYPNGQGHVATPVEYPESPPVGGEHDGEWADCTGTVYSVDIRNENAVHSLEHGAVWITYDPERVSEDDVATLSELVDGTSGRMLSPRPGLAAPISLQSWNNQLTVEAATDRRLQQAADFLTFNPDSTPEVGATCENPGFISSPLVAGDASRAG
ncbi:DUF3105 domain-containing protein [Blastococcus sp. KM273128]|uniref:DUF3105 domain-containing protein n=1 Tax=Blastococcus sp. KM273128 TaxID=2570314 RepID=UPI001F1D0561|nr:DUF3105 domain-containing protein [Blastococcus sp. KM273128]MCF6744991.1 DUF3105 domain-containing protein [Blastococcus sp. KM273128]